MPKVLLTVALVTDLPNVEGRIRAILAGAEPLDHFPRTACVTALPLEDVEARHQNALARLHGDPAVTSLRLPTDQDLDKAYGGTD